MVTNPWVLDQRWHCPSWILTDFLTIVNLLYSIENTGLDVSEGTTNLFKSWGK